MIKSISLYVIEHANRLIGVAPVLVLSIVPLSALEAADAALLADTSINSNSRATNYGGQPTLAIGSGNSAPSSSSIFPRCRV